MKKIKKLLLSSLLLVSMIGCNNSETNESKNINVSVSIPDTTQKNTEGLNLKSFQTDIQSVLLQVYTQDPEALLQTKAMTKDEGTGLWNVDLVLNAENAPFDFKALAYETLVTPETLNDNTPIFTGETIGVSANEAVIVLTETNESINASIRKLPVLSSVDSLAGDDALDLTFNFVNSTEGTLSYALSSIANDGAGATCATPLFSPATGSLSVEATSFTSTLTFDAVNCESPKHFLTLTTSTNDSIKIPFTLSVDSTTVSIALPPVLSNLNIIDNENAYSLEAVVTDANGLNLSYAWSVVEGNGTFDDNTANPTLLSGSNRANALEVLIVVTNIDTTASSSVRYQVLASSAKVLVTREELISMINNGEDVTNVDTSGITDMSGPLFPNDFNQDISGWDTSAVTTMSYMFSDASSFNQNISSWDTSSVITMSAMFFNASDFNQNISTWNTSAVLIMRGMFINAISFNENISIWDTSTVRDMSYMFNGANNFNQDISTWDTSAVTRMEYMFNQATSFNQDISSWDTSSATRMDGMFSLASSFNQDISTWNTSAITTMNSMFNQAISFNHNLSVWDTSTVTDMYSMFFYTSSFNQDISDWNTSAVTNMSNMFGYSSNFNQDIGSWDTSSVTTMSFMFSNALSFNQNISGWNVNSVGNYTSFSDNAPLTPTNTPNFP